MSQILRLPPELANQIAAGEVVERPASVVKELVENALDAGAARIAVVIEMGGKRLVRVEDDGQGMDPEDAVLALERHATSKVRRADDLAAIRTLGFRGEALPSIASVSRLTLRTRARGQPTGTEVRVNGGVVSSVREAGAPEGTTIEVEELFYNLPARRKFLKADAAESAQISRLVTQMALCYPEVGFTLTSAGRRVLQAPPVTRLEDRFYQLYGDRPDLVPVAKAAGGIRVHGLVAALGDQGPTRGPQNVFVNRRIVKDRTIAHAITAAYAVATIKEKSPEAHLFIEMPPDRVDVNVHPTKAEVRFLESGLVHEVIRRAVGDAIGTSDAPRLQLQGGAAAPSAGESASRTPTAGVLADLWRPMPTPGEGAAEAVDGGAASPGGLTWVGGPPFSPEAGGVVATGPEAGTAGPTLPPLARGDVAAASGDLERQRMIDAVRPMMPLGQFRNTYIIAVDAEGLAIIDQHVAHERVLFEQVMERLTDGSLPSQRLLTPLVLELPPGSREALLAREDDLTRLGFEVADYGGRSVRVAAVPALVGVTEIEQTVRALADDLEGLDRGAPVEQALRQVAATMACHAAVKANQPLSHEKMVYLLDELRRTAYSAVCPHGRPVVLRLTRREIEKNFQRI
ncbi:MAG: DNA mismatch repair endonuclease MutL [Vicinamibacteraceae bacterium]|nr:DNA mismatch repair endonuclease MutL [Vicinamibacteraceae bacterium]